MELTFLCDDSGNIKNTAGITSSDNLNPLSYYYYQIVKQTQIPLFQLFLFSVGLLFHLLSWPPCPSSVVIRQVVEARLKRSSSYQTRRPCLWGCKAAKSSHIYPCTFKMTSFPSVLFFSWKELLPKGRWRVVLSVWWHESTVRSHRTHQSGV